MKSNIKKKMKTFEDMGHTCLCNALPKIKKTIEEVSMSYDEYYGKKFMDKLRKIEYDTI